MFIAYPARVPCMLDLFYFSSFAYVRVANVTVKINKLSKFIARNVTNLDWALSRRPFRGLSWAVNV